MSITATPRTPAPTGSGHVRGGVLVSQQVRQAEAAVAGGERVVARLVRGLLVCSTQPGVSGACCANSGQLIWR